MAELPAYGKIGKDFFDSIIYPQLGASRAEVIVGPSPGVDTCVVKCGSRAVLVATTDPLSYIPELGPVDSAWLSVNLIASDLATSGFKPQYAVLDFNLPLYMASEDFKVYWKALSEECSNLGIAIIGGHTGKFEGCNYTIIGAGFMFSIGSEAKYVTSKGGSSGDQIIVTKGAAIAATGILGRVFPNIIKEKIGEEILSEAVSNFRKISVVEDALTASKIGVRAAGITAMHDATEGGVVSALCELAHASSCGFLVDKDKIPLSRAAKEICKLFEIDPFQSLSEGSLLLACKPSKVEKALEVLSRKAITCAVIGELREQQFGMKFLDNGVETTIDHPFADPYWKAYYNAKERGWN